MTDVLSYRQYAADCLRQAQEEDTPDGEAILLNVALAWLRLAQQHEAMASEPVAPGAVVAQQSEAATATEPVA